MVPGHQNNCAGHFRPEALCFQSQQAIDFISYGCYCRNCAFKNAQEDKLQYNEPVRQRDPVSLPCKTCGWARGSGADNNSCEVVICLGRSKVDSSTPGEYERCGAINLACEIECTNWRCGAILPRGNAQEAQQTYFTRHVALGSKVAPDGNERWFCKKCRMICPPSRLTCTTKDCGARRETDGPSILSTTSSKD
jgi:hypothetical protein